MHVWHRRSRGGRRSSLALLASLLLAAGWAAPAAAQLRNPTEIALSGAFSGSRLTGTGISVFVILSDGHGGTQLFRVQVGSTVLINLPGNPEDMVFEFGADIQIRVSMPGTQKQAIVTNLDGPVAPNVTIVSSPNLSIPGQASQATQPRETMAVDAQGNVYTSTGNSMGAASLTIVSPAGTVSSAQIPTPAGAAFPPDALNLTLGPDGNVWFTETLPFDSSGNQIANSNKMIGRVTPSGVVTQFAVPTNFAGTGSINTNTGTYITAGGDGNVWFVEASVGNVAKITPAGVVTEYPLGVGGGLMGLALGGDGNIWVRSAVFSQAQNALVTTLSRVTPSGTVTNFANPTSNTGSDVELVLGPDGALWYPEDQKIGRITITGTIQEFALPTPTVSGQPNFAFQLAFAPNGSGAFLEFSSSKLVTFTAPTSPLLAAVLPGSRSAQPNGTVTAFATVLNTGASPATSCSIRPFATVPAVFAYQTTDPKTNALSGTVNTPANIAANGSQSFVIALTPNSAIASTNVLFDFGCSNVNSAPIVVGLDTLLLSASATPTPDVIALAATLQGDGIVHVTGSPMTGVFAVASDNIGFGDTITVGTNTGAATLPVTITLCQTNPQTGACLATAAATVSTTINTNATPTFGIFVAASSTVPFDPANSRIFVTFTDSTKTVRGATSVAVETQ
jgi:streptogramin lyase